MRGHDILLMEISDLGMTRHVELKGSTKGISSIVEMRLFVHQNDTQAGQAYLLHEIRKILVQSNIFSCQGW